MSSKCIVITGSTRGIGLGLAREFLQRGHRLVLNGRKAEVLDGVLKEFRDEGFRVEGVAGDVCEPGVFGALIEKAVKVFGGIDIWINNAGIPQSNRYFHELDPAEIDRLIRVNLISVLQGSREVLRFYCEQGYGLLLNLEGLGSDGRMVDKIAVYGTTKRAVQYFSKALAREVKEPGIRVGIISPGMVRTDFLKESSSVSDPEERRRNQKVFSILAEDVEVVTPILADKILRSRKHYPRIEYLTFRRLFPKIVRLMFVKK